MSDDYTIFSLAFLSFACLFLVFGFCVCFFAQPILRENDSKRKTYYYASYNNNTVHISPTKTPLYEIE